MKRYCLHWELHPEKDDNWYEAQKLRMTQDEVARELDISYTLSVSGRVFPQFNERKHVSFKPLLHNPIRPIYRLWDFGKTNVVKYGQMDEFGRRRLFHERLLEDSDTYQQVKIALQDSKTMFPDCQFVDICDPAGSWDDGRGVSTHVDILNEEKVFPEYEKILAVPMAERKKRGIAMIQKDLQIAPGGEDAFQIYVSEDRTKGCPITFKAYQFGYAYKTDINGNNTDKIDEKHPYEDVIDVDIYWYLQTEKEDPSSQERFIPRGGGDPNEITGYG